MNKDNYNYHCGEELGREAIITRCACRAILARRKKGRLGEGVTHERRGEEA
jgi:hypothetical protein